jgi:peptide/nickel transport system permease protein
VGAFIARRVLVAVPTLLAISFVMYAILALAPIDPLAQFALDPRVPPEVRENVRHSLGLDQPWPIRYVKWLTAIAQGNFGVSFMTHSSVSDLIWQRLPNTLAVVGVAYVIGTLVALPLGVIAAVRRNLLVDRVLSLASYAGFSIPTFFTGILLIIIFSIKLRWFTFLYDSRLQVTDLDTLWLWVRQSIMPITVLGLFNAAVLIRYVRAAVLENLPLDYVRTAHAKGLSERFVVLRHVMRNSLIPVVTLIALGAPTVFGGAIVTEQIFHVPGVGELLVTSIGTGDTPVVIAVVLIFAVLVVAFNLLADVLYAVLDPRIRYS